MSSDAVLQAHGLAEAVQEVDEPHALFGGIHAAHVAVFAPADVGMLVDDVIEVGFQEGVLLVRRRLLHGFGLGNVEEAHAGRLVDGQHRAREAADRFHEAAARHVDALREACRACREH